MASGAQQQPPQPPRGGGRPVVGRTPKPFEGWDKEQKLKKWKGGVKGKRPDDDAANRV